MLFPKSIQDTSTIGFSERYQTTTFSGKPVRTEFSSVGGFHTVRKKITEAFIASDRVYPTDYTVGTTLATIKLVSRWFNDYGSWYTSGGGDYFDQSSRLNSLYGDFPVTADIFAQNPVHLLDWNRVDLKTVNNQVLEKLDDSGVELGALIVELGETVSYLTSIGATIINFGRAVYSGRFNKAVRELGVTKKRWVAFQRRPDNSVSSRWLEFNFAIRPLIGDIATIAELHQNPTAVLQALRFNARSRKSGNFTVPVILYDAQSYPGSTCSFSYKTTVSVTYSIHNAEVVALKALGLYNAPAALYEGVPFSWLIDYAVNFGDYLKALTATSGFRFVHGYQSCVVNQHTTVFAQRKLTTGKTWANERYEGAVSTRVYVRKRLATFPTPSIQSVFDDLTLRKVSYVGALISLLTTKR